MQYLGEEEQQVKRPCPRQRRACPVGGPSRRLDEEKRVKRGHGRGALEDVAWVIIRTLAFIVSEMGSYCRVLSRRATWSYIGCSVKACRDRKGDQLEGLEVIQVRCNGDFGVGRRQWRWWKVIKLQRNLEEAAQKICWQTKCRVWKKG